MSLRISSLALAICLLIGSAVSSLHGQNVKSTTQPEIDIWYGHQQRFGHLGGHPQRWINVLGSVDPADQLVELTYSLNGGEPKELSFREDNKRIARDGDFNVEIARDQLDEGHNRVTVRAVSGSGQTATADVSVQYTKEAESWPLPYRIDWSDADHIQDVVQVVDGRWKLTPQGIRSVPRYYDRVIAFGDESWRDYEVATTVTIHALTPPKKLPNTTGVTHAAIALRWPGHDADGKQPSVKWHPLGATAEFRLGGDLKQCRWRIFDGKRKDHRESSRRRQLEFEKPYAMKHRVETLNNGVSRYRVKLWPADEREPTDWDLERLETDDDVPSGSALLLAHHSEVTFGDVTVTPIGPDGP